MRIAAAIGVFLIVALFVLSSFVNAAEYEVRAEDSLEFNPKDIVIQVGDTVKWTNLQSYGHAVAEADSASSTKPKSGGWSSGYPDAMPDEWSYTFTKPGTYHYICEPHIESGMRGTVTVQGEGNDTNASSALKINWALMALILIISAVASMRMMNH
eukprot:GEZU01006689.1.p1 GENE.GEZU01006689.1~~GEZU01006689.1.p1  ORF type:complete len:156 (+),score=39.02 GEZU01006689.1:134-601(+)